MLEAAVALIAFVIFDPIGILIVGTTLPSSHLSFPVRSVLCLVHTYLFCYLSLASSLLCGIIFSYLFYITFLYTTELRLGLPSKKNRSRSHIRENVKNLQCVFRAFQVLHKYWMNFFGPYILVFHGAFMISTIFHFFVAIRYWPGLQTYAKIPLVGGGIVNLIIWTNLLEFGRIMFSRGSKVLSSWKGNKWKSRDENRAMAKFRVSCEPLLIAHGTQFVIRRGNLFLFYKGIMRGIVRVLLTTK